MARISRLALLETEEMRQVLVANIRLKWPEIFDERPRALRYGIYRVPRTGGPRYWPTRHIPCNFLAEGKIDNELFDPKIEGSLSLDGV